MTRASPRTAVKGLGAGAYLLMISDTRRAHVITMTDDERDMILRRLG